MLALYLSNRENIVDLPLAALLAQPSSIDHLLEKDARSVLRIAGILVQHLHYRQARINTNEISQLKRAHWYVGAILHDGIDIIASTDTCLEANNGLVDVWHQNAVCEETWRVGGDGRDLAHGLAECDRSIESLLAGLETGDDLNTLLDWDGVHEVGGDDAGGGGGVGCILCG